TMTPGGRCWPRCVSAPPDLSTVASREGGPITAFSVFQPDHQDMRRTRTLALSASWRFSMKRVVTVMIPALFTIGLASPALSQTYVPPPLRIVGLSGPRFGVTVLDRGVLDRLEERAITVRPVISQFGWQLEKQFFSASSGLTALNEW